VVAVLEGGANAVYHLSGVTPFGQAMGVTLYGADGVLHYDLAADRLSGASRRAGASPGGWQEMKEIPIPPEKAGRWRVEEDFVRSIREGAPVGLTDFAAGVRYMEFTEAVALSARTHEAVDLPDADDQPAAQARG
jgi:predicted dehydrogenase